MKVVIGLTLLAFYSKYFVSSIPLNETLANNVEIVKNLEVTAESLINRLSSNHKEKFKHIISEKDIKKKTLIAAKSSTSQHVTSIKYAIPLKTNTVQKMIM